MKLIAQSAQRGGTSGIPKRFICAEAASGRTASPSW